MLKNVTIGAKVIFNKTQVSHKKGVFTNHEVGDVSVITSAETDYKGIIWIGVNGSETVIDINALDYFIG